jgi:hypothetical protein
LFSIPFIRCSHFCLRLWLPPLARIVLKARINLADCHDGAISPPADSYGTTLMRTRSPSWQYLRRIVGLHGSAFAIHLCCGGLNLAICRATICGIPVGLGHCLVIVHPLPRLLRMRLTSHLKMIVSYKPRRTIATRVKTSKLSRIAERILFGRRRVIDEL